MKIFFDQDVFENQKFGGISRYIVELHRAINSYALAESYLCAPFCENEYLSSISRKDGVISGPNILSVLPLGKRRMRDLILDMNCISVRPDVLHTTYYLRHRRPPLARSLVVTVHDMTHELFPEHFSQPEILSEKKRRAVFSADHVICISEKTKEDLQSIFGLPESKCTVVHHGITQLPMPSTLPKALSDRPYILYVGQRRGYKNFSALVHAFSCRRRLNNELRIICCGGGRISADERYEIQEAGISMESVVQISGDDALLSSLYASAKAIVYPSRYEGFGMPILEAFNSRCPIIALPVGAIPEIGGNAIRYVEEDTPEAWADAIEAVVLDDDEANRLRILGESRAKHFNWKRCAEETCKVYGMLKGQ